MHTEPAWPDPASPRGLVTCCSPGSELVALQHPELSPHIAVPFDVIARLPTSPVKPSLFVSHVAAATNGHKPGGIKQRDTFSYSS